MSIHRDRRSLIFDQLWNAPTCGRAWVVDHRPEAVEVHDGRVSPRAIALAAGRVAALLESQHVGHGDRCIVWLDQPLDILIATSALTAIGAVPILISPALGIDMVVSMFSSLPPVERIITTSGRVQSCSVVAVRGRCDDWASLIGEARDLAPRRASVALPLDAPYVVTHTSGTTGVNKLVEYTRAAADHNSYTQEIPALIGRLRGYAALAVSPVHFRFVVGVLAALRRRVPLIVLADHHPDSVGPLLKRWRPIYLETHPNTFMQWERLAPTGSLASVRCFLSTFDVIHPGTITNLLAGSRHRFAVFIEIYGQSEVCAIAGRMHVKGLAGRLMRRNATRGLNGHLIGWIVPGHSRVRIVNECGRIVGSHIAGRIQVRSTGRFSTYLNNSQAALDNLTLDGWWDTGDYGWKDRVGRLTLIDRQVERLTAAASAIAMEDALLDRMPWLLEAVVLEREQALVPVVATRSGAFDDAGWRAATGDLPTLRSPIVIDEQAIPRTATGKVQRTVLSALVFDGEGHHLHAAADLQDAPATAMTERVS